MSVRDWQPLIEGLLEAVILVDALELRILAANRGAEQLLGAGPGSLAGKPVVDVTTSPEDVFFWEDVASGLAQQILSDVLLTRADGTTVQVTRRVTAAHLQDGPSVYVLALHDRTEEVRIEGELEQLLAELRATLESTADGILTLDMEGAIRGYNKRFSELWDIGENLLVHRDDAAVFAWMEQCVVDRDEYIERLVSIHSSPLVETSDLVVLRAGHVLERVTLPQFARGRPIGRVFSFRDITRRLADEARLEMAAKVFKSSLDAIFITDAEHRIVSVNPSFERLTGFSQEQVVGHSPSEFLANRGAEPEYAQLQKQLIEDGFWEGEIWNRNRDGSASLCLISLVQVRDEAGDSTNFIGFFKDLTDALAARQRIEELAYHDALTGLPNRLMFTERFEAAQNLADRNSTAFAILFIDLDRFKHINDSLGHMFGDRVLVEVAGRLNGCLRQVDILSRLGGDEFLILLNQTGGRGAESTVRRLLEALSQPFSLSDIAFTVTCSIGIALYPDDGATLDDLIKNADSAMYAVKEHGRSGFRFYKRQMNIDLLSRVKLDHAIRQALELGGFRLKFQPQVDMDSGGIVGAEALIRWHDPELGIVPPGRFIPVAEESGAIVPLGDWVLQQAARQASSWYHKGLRIVTAINVSAVQFQRSDFVDRVAAALHVTALPAHLLELELTESILIQNAEETLKRLEALVRLGVQLAIDDFGTGYSSLAYLKRFPIHKLKIDKSFVHDLPNDESGAAIVHAIIDLGHAMQLDVIAEGVETEDQRSFLLECGCDELQGFLCSAALDKDAFEDFYYAQQVQKVTIT